MVLLISGRFSYQRETCRRKTFKRIEGRGGRKEGKFGGSVAWGMGGCREFKSVKVGLANDF